MQLNPNKSLEDNYRDWIQSVRDNAQFFAKAWTESAKTEFSTPRQSINFIHQLEPELPSSYTPSIDGTVDNLERVIFQSVVLQLSKDAKDRKWRD